MEKCCSRKSAVAKTAVATTCAMALTDDKDGKKKAGTTFIGRYHVSGHLSYECSIYTAQGSTLCMCIPSTWISIKHV